MNEKDRILELVQKGIISSEEGITLLEKLAQKSTVEQEPVAEPKVEDYEAADKKQFDAILEGIASTVTSFSSAFDDIEDMIDELEDQIDDLEDQIDEIEEQAELEALTVDQQMKIQRLKEESEVLKSQKASLEEEQKQVQAAKRAAKKEEMNEAIKKAKQKVADSEWKQTTTDSFTEFGSVVGKIAGQFAKAVSETVKNMSDTLQFDGDIKIKFPYKFNLGQAYHFEQPAGEVSIIDVKVANGDVRLKTAPQESITIDGELRVKDEFDTDAELEEFLKERVNVSLESDTFSLSIPSKKVYADVTIILPEKDYDYVSVKALNSSIRLKDITGKDYYLESKNGDISLKNTKGTMLEVVGTNGDLKLFDGSFQDVVFNGTNGNILLDGEVLSADLKTVNGNVVSRIQQQTTKHIQAKTVNGSVKFDVAEDLEIEADLKTSLGTLKYDKDVYEVIRQEKGTTTQAVELRKQDKEIPIKLHGRTTTGTIKLNQVQYKNDKN